MVYSLPKFCTQTEIKFYSGFATVKSTLWFLRKNTGYKMAEAEFVLNVVCMATFPTMDDALPQKKRNEALS